MRGLERRPSHTVFEMKSRTQMRIFLDIVPMTKLRDCSHTSTHDFISIPVSLVTSFAEPIGVQCASSEFSPDDRAISFRSRCGTPRSSSSSSVASVSFRRRPLHFEGGYSGGFISIPVCSFRQRLSAGNSFRSRCLQFDAGTGNQFISTTAPSIRCRPLHFETGLKDHSTTATNGSRELTLRRSAGGGARGRRGNWWHQHRR